VELLTKRGIHVRVLTRDRTRARHLPDRVEIVEGNVRDPETLTPAMAGVTSVISAIQGLDHPKSDPGCHTRRLQVYFTEGTWVGSDVNRHRK
jgi:uncharacterized protein YbjT (DUF2867 family)